MKYNCATCNKEFIDTPSSLRIFCTRRCKEKWQFSDPTRHPMWKGGLKEYECLLCKKTFNRKPSNIKQSKKTFCSSKCQAIWKCKHQKNKNTDIEIRMAEVLRENKIEFIEQVVYPNICIADFYLPKYNLAIFCDGEYWHDYPDGKARDRNQVENLKEIGVNAIRLWGNQIKEEEPLKYLEKFLNE